MPECSYAFCSRRLQSCFLHLSEIICFLILCLAITGCQPSGDTHSDIKLNWDIEPNPPSVGLATINITLRDSTEQVLTGADVQLEGNMSHPGMKPVFASAEEVEPGQYSAPFEFTMGGDWFILITTTLEDGKVVEKQIEIPGVRSK